MLERRQRLGATRRFKRQTGLAIFFFRLSFYARWSGVDAQTLESGQLLSGKQTARVASYRLTRRKGSSTLHHADLASAEVFFDVAGGPVSLVYLVLDAQGTGYLTFDDGPNSDAPGGVLVIQELQTRAERTFNPARDRLLTGSKVGLSEPKDLILVEDLGLLIVADFGAADLKVFDALGSGATLRRVLPSKSWVAPLAVTLAALGGWPTTLLPTAFLSGRPTAHCSCTIPFCWIKVKMAPAVWSFRPLTAEQCHTIFTNSSISLTPTRWSSPTLERQRRATNQGSTVTVRFSLSKVPARYPGRRRSACGFTGRIRSSVIRSLSPREAMMFSLGKTASTCFYVLTGCCVVRVK